MPTIIGAFGVVAILVAAVIAIISEHPRGKDATTDADVIKKQQGE